MPSNVNFRPSYVLTRDLVECTRLYVLSGVQFEVSGILVRDAKAPTRAVVPKRWICAGGNDAAADALPGYPFVFHTHPLHAVATSSNSPFSCPTGADLALDLVNLAQSGRDVACSLTLTTVGVFVVATTAAAREIFRRPDPIRDKIISAIAKIPRSDYSLGDTVAAWHNEMDLLCHRRRLDAMTDLADRSPENRKMSATLAAAFRASDVGSKACRQWAKIISKSFTAAALVPGARGSNAPLFRARFFSLKEIAQRKKIYLPARAPPSPLISPRPGLLRPKLAFSRADFQSLFLGNSAPRVTTASEELARRIWKNILLARRDYAAKRIARSLFRRQARISCGSRRSSRTVMHTKINAHTLRSLGVPVSP